MKLTQDSIIIPHLSSLERNLMIPLSMLTVTFTSTSIEAMRSAGRWRRGEEPSGWKVKAEWASGVEEMGVGGNEDGPSSPGTGVTARGQRIIESDRGTLALT